MVRLFCLLVAIFSLSGCCRVLGVCTSASIHTSIPSRQKFAEQRSPHAALAGSQTPVLAGLNQLANGRTE